MAEKNSWVDQARLFIPQDRRVAMAYGYDLPVKVEGAALFADVSGFTSLTEAFTESYGIRRGAEELPLYLNAIYEALISEVDRFGGSVISFSGDAITCWFDKFHSPSQGESPSLRATICALAMQSAMRAFSNVLVAGRNPVALAVKVAVTSGPACRFTVGDPKILLFDVLAGETLNRMAAVESFASRGEVLVDEFVIDQLGEVLVVADWRPDHVEPDHHFAMHW